MTTIGVKYHNEDIHNIIRKPMSPTIKSPRYKSKSIYKSDSIDPTGINGTTAGVTSVAVRKQRKYNGHQTFGLAHYKAPEAKNFLKKKSERVLHAPGKLKNKREFKCTINCKSSSIPKRSFENRKQVRKNFVRENIKKAAALQPKLPVPKKVETPRGTVKDMAHLLQMIKIRQSEEYGKIPKYLHIKKEKEEKKRKEQELKMQAIKDYKEKMGVQNLETENVYMIDSDTRQKILDGLKENWNELSKQFLKLPVMTDTWPKIKRKMWLEKEIEQLEKDIRLVESHPYIYLEKQAGSFSEEVVQENISQGNTLQQDQEKEIIKGKLEKEETAQLIQSPIEDSSEEKKEEDKEINILNY